VADQVGDAALTQERKGERLQILLALLLGTAALATAWAAYQGDLYSGDSVITLNRSVQTSDKASLAFTAAQANFNEDVTLFTDFAVLANTDAKSGAAEYINDSLMRPELKKQVEWWSGTDDDVTTPFVKENPFFTAVKDDPAANKLESEATAQFEQAIDLDNTGDRFTLYTVLFAAALFLYGIASVASSTKVFVASSAVGALLFVVGLGMMIATTIGAPPLL
jgi:hypothetical protein